MTKAALRKELKSMLGNVDAATRSRLLKTLRCPYCNAENLHWEIRRPPPKRIYREEIEAMYALRGQEPPSDIPAVMYKVSGPETTEVRCGSCSFKVQNGYVTSHSL